MTTFSSDSPRLLTVVQLCLLAILVVQGARLLLGVLAPVIPTQAASPLPVDLHVPAAAQDPFYPEGGPSPPATASQGEWTLHGFRHAPHGAGSSAILSQAGTPQAAYRVGDVLAGGAVLESVGNDHVLLRRDARTLRVDLPAQGTLADAGTAGTALPTSLPPAPVAGGTPAGTEGSMPVDPVRLLSAARLSAHREQGRVVGYTVMPGSDDALLREAGLRPGDVLLDVDGQALDPERLLELASDLGTAGHGQLTFRRDGQTHTLRLGGRGP